MIIFIQFVSALITFLIGYRLVMRLDEKFATVASEKKLATVVAICFLLLVSILNRKMDFGGGILRGLFEGALVLAAFCDYCTYDIYDFVYLPALGSGIVMMFRCGDVAIKDLVIFLILQGVLFSRMYGISDCIAFSVCAIWIAALGGTLPDFLIHMLLTVILCAVVQGLNRNINKQGNLKKGVAFIPYIAASMVLW